MTRRILFLMSDTGGGHRAAANAISEAIHFLYPSQFDIIIEDIWAKDTPWPIRRMPNAYPWLSDSGTRWWLLFWQVTARPPVRRGMMHTAYVLARRQMVKFLRETQPDIVVSVHPAMNHLGLRWARKAGLHVPFYTVVTDMVTVHPSWICPDVTHCLVPTEIAGETAVALGLPREKLSVVGQPVQLKFAQLSGAKETLRQELGLVPQRAAVLIVGGGEGVGRVYDIARAIAQGVPQAQLLIVAGRNKALKQKLDRVAWEIPTRVYGFVDNMPDLMTAVDILVSKAGPGTLSEAFITGLPVIISGFVPGQETGNVQYVVDNEAGAFAPEPGEIVRLIHEWLRPGNSTLAHMRANAARLAQPHASLEIARILCAPLVSGGQADANPAQRIKKATRN